ncbi:MULTISPECIES: ABC transporter ATP-binding protein [Sutcliffiella]|uniref:ABC transporter ATP-binding protein n=1 Tax=Sutcliffiella cohnii TaxID=33932 RepID=A0A223KQ52_9BACI|nr:MULTISPECIES: ABC transporter ATP-binding protein [Sutcliffiella]AST91468.1 ABC transporter ATP-binding protein [Sutcliffiella cohnii]WBL17298.1 ABC transporter ATP-binding protein [Sutcliffiella sp. NC1]
MITIKNLSHEFIIGKKNNKQKIPVLNDINLSIYEGEIVSIVGKSGSGKSTLLNLMSGFMKPTSGTIEINGMDVTKLTEAKWSEFRLNHIGFIFQSFQLIPTMTAFANVELPLKMVGVGEHARKIRVLEVLEKVGLNGFEEFYPSELSGGQQQRVGIARALITKPNLILADEPTGSLDSETEQEFLQFIKQLNEIDGITFVIITHDQDVARIAHRTVQLKHGRLEERGELYEVSR